MGKRNVVDYHLNKPQGRHGRHDPRHTTYPRRRPRHCRATKILPAMVTPPPAIAVQLLTPAIGLNSAALAELGRPPATTPLRRPCRHAMMPSAACVVEEAPLRHISNPGLRQLPPVGECLGRPQPSTTEAWSACSAGSGKRQVAWCGVRYVQQCVPCSRTGEPQCAVCGVWCAVWCVGMCMAGGELGNAGRRCVARVA